MYGKIFESIYDGSLACGDWEALIVFQQLIVLADQDGVIDMTSIALHRRTTIPLPIIEKGLKALQEPDPISRSKNEDGRRIVLLDEERNWGWVIVNYAYYRDLAKAADRREKNKESQRKSREQRHQSSSHVISSQQPSAEIEHKDIDSDVNIDSKIKTKATKRFVKPSIEEINTYCRERKNAIDAEQFFNHYETNGWMRGKTPIKNWKACVITWEKRDNRNNSNGQNKQSNRSRTQQFNSELDRLAQKAIDKGETL